MQNQPAKILVVAPPPIKMAKGRPEVSEKYGCEAGDANGVHFTLESHLRLGKAIAEAILAMDANDDGNTNEKHTIDKLKADIEM